MNKDLTEQRKKDMERFDKIVDEVSSQFPNHEVKEFTFSALERQILADQDTIIALAQETEAKVLNELTLKRIGIMPDPSIKVRYSVGLGRFVCFIPKSFKVDLKNAKYDSNKANNSHK